MRTLFPCESYVTDSNIASYAAFCRQFGNHCTPAAGKHNWNEEAIDGMVKDLKRPWKALCARIEDREIETGRFVEELTDWSIQYLGKPSSQQQLRSALFNLTNPLQHATTCWKHQILFHLSTKTVRVLDCLRSRTD